MPSETAVCVTLLFDLFVRFVITMIVVIVLAETRPFPADTRFRFKFARGAAGRAAPSGDPRITIRVPMHEALARYHHRPLLLVNYLDNDQIYGLRFPKRGGPGIDPESIEVPRFSWELYNRPQL